MLKSDDFCNTYDTSDNKTVMVALLVEFYIPPGHWLV